MAAVLIDTSNTILIVTDIISVIFILLGTIYLTQTLRTFKGEKVKNYAKMIGSGMLLVVMLHEMGEFVCRIGAHGGKPATLLGEIHIIFFGVIGSIVFIIGCILLYRKYSKMFSA